jgi:hypothetical protein
MHMRIRRARSERYFEEARPWILLGVLLIVGGHVAAYLIENPRARRRALWAGLLLLYTAFAIWPDHH